MAIDFPDSPVDGQVFSVGTRSWVYYSSSNTWISGSGPVGPTGPTGPTGADSFVTGPTGPTGESFIQLDGGEPGTIYGGTAQIDSGGV